MTHMPETPSFLFRQSALGPRPLSPVPGSRDDNKAWQLIDKAGCRGLKLGDAQVSEQHCNFLINNDKASASDLENLGEEVRKRVKETSGIELHWEIKRLGHKAPNHKTSEH